ncbi:MAG: hypothetical protein QM831_13455 [Kofleriaceae bacterium]
MRSLLLVALVACTPVRGSGDIGTVRTKAPPQVQVPPAPPLVERAPAIAPVVSPRIELAVSAETEYRALGVHDARLDAVAADLARFADAGGSADSGIAERLLRLHGIVEPVEHVATATTRAELDKLWWDEQNRPNARWAVATTKTGVIGVLVYAAFITLDPIPREGTRWTFAGTFQPHVDNPQITVDGKRKLPVKVEGHHFTGELACPSPGQHLVSIEVFDTKRTFLPAVVFPVYCGVALAKLTGEPFANLASVTPETFPDRLVGIIDRERAEVSLPPLHWNTMLLRATETMLADRSERRMSAPEWHVKQAGIRNPYVQFTVVHADSLAGVVSKVLDDSAQNEKYFDGHNSDVAVAIKPVADGYWVSVGYLAVPTVLDISDVQEILSKRIRAVQEKRYSDRAGANTAIYEWPTLSMAATKFARQIAIGWTPEAIQEEYKRTYWEYALSIENSIDLDNFDLEPILKKHDFYHWGVGIAQAPQDGPSAGMFYIVIYYVSEDGRDSYRELMTNRSEKR